MIAQVGLAAGSSILLAGAIAGEPPLWLIYTGLAVLAASSSLDGPTRSAIVARVLEPAQLPAAQALNQVVWNTAGSPRTAARRVGDRVGRWRRHRRVRGRPRVDRCMFVAATLLRPDATARERSRATRAWRAIREGFYFARKHRLIMSTFVIDLIAMIFGLPRVLFPFLIVRSSSTDRREGDRAPVRGARRRRPARGADERLDGQGPPARDGRDRVGGGVGRGDRRVRAGRTLVLAGSRDARARGLGGRDQRDLPDDDPADGRLRIACEVGSSGSTSLS